MIEILLITQVILLAAVIYCHHHIIKQREIAENIARQLKYCVRDNLDAYRSLMNDKSISESQVLNHCPKLLKPLFPVLYGLFTNSRVQRMVDFESMTLAKEMLIQMEKESAINILFFYLELLNDINNKSGADGFYDELERREYRRKNDISFPRN